MDPSDSYSYNSNHPNGYYTDSQPSHSQPRPSPASQSRPAHQQPQGYTDYYSQQPHYTSHPQPRPPPPLPSPPLPPNPYQDHRSTSSSSSSRPPPPGAQPPQSRTPIYQQQQQQPQYPSYLGSNSSPQARAEREYGYGSRGGGSAYQSSSRAMYESQGVNGVPASGSRDSMASGIISMYEGGGGGGSFGAGGATAYSSPSESPYSTAGESPSSYFSSPMPQASSNYSAGGSYSASTSNSLRPAYPSSSSSPNSGYQQPSTSSATYDYLSHGAPPPSSSSRPVYPSTSTEGLRDRARPSFSSTSSSSARPTPSDGFYTPEPMPVLPERKQSLEKFASAGGGGEWRGESYSNGTSSGGGGGSSYRQTPTRQPTIVTTPPIGSTSSNGWRNPSISSQASTSTSSHPTFFSPVTGTLRRPSNSPGTLSPNTSLTASSSQQLRRADSTESYEARGGGEQFLNPAFLSNLAVFVKDQVPRGMRRKGAVEHPGSFTGEEVVTTLHRALSSAPGCDRKYALIVARSLHQSLWFHEVDWSDALLKDGGPYDKVYAFLQDEQRDDHYEEDDLFEIPTGVLTNATPCYSPYCGKMSEEGVAGSCYSYACPNKIRNQLQRQGSTLSAHSGVDPVEESENWETSVPSSVLDALTKKEIMYQSIVFELIQGEVKYLQDLEFIEKGFVEPLKTANPPIISPARLPTFLTSILLNIASIRTHSRHFLEALQARQKESFVFRGIGQLIFSAAVEWGPDYTEYTVGFPLADWEFKEEKSRNPRFNDLLMDFQKRPEASKRGFDTFHNRATFRGLRYDLLLAQIYKNAPEDDPDREYVKQAMEVIKQQALDANEGIAETKAKVALREYQRDLVYKSGDSLDLELLDDSRRFFMAGKVFRRPDGTGFTEWSEAHLILLDHYLVTTKPPRERDGRQKYAISRRAVPLDLIQLKPSSFTEPPVPKSSGFHLRSAKFTGTERHPSSNGSVPGGGYSGPSPSSPLAGGAQDSSLAYPIHFHQMGRFNGPVYYYVESAALRSEWEKRLREAIALRSQRQAANRVVRLDPLADQTFGTTSTAVGSLTPNAPAANQFGRPTCSVPLTTADGQSLVIATCSEGLFIGVRGRPNSMRKVLHLPDITQCAVLPEFGFVLVVANRVLIAYSLEALIPSASGSKLDPALKAPQRLSGQKDVSFFRVGRVGDADPRTLVIYAKKSGVKESVFKALEPVSQSDRSAKGGGAHRFLGFTKSSPDWFRAHKEFFMPTLVTSIQFHRSKLALVGPRGVEIMDLDSMRTMTVPDFPSSRHDRTFVGLAKRCEEAQTLGMFRLQDSKFLLVYNEFAFHVGRHGEPIEGPVMEWESKPDHVAYCAPFVLLFSSTIIEIRDAFTGRLAQFITGSQINLTFDGAGLSSGVIDVRSPRPGVVREDDPDERIHFSMREGSYHVLYEIAPLV
ncbi:CNH domain-domain-containing protein [Leucosporidium creatinivorum]|uniref:CNH domain-domain-containing protein n=1 Tax=Leucosporidium creatinivorum TaxID=106004 RepID=A0A1Y2G0Q3_9BASI|nr:CNH domain-domain-containing protein [Leucosporidium creatinivorum]